MFIRIVICSLLTAGSFCSLAAQLVLFSFDDASGDESQFSASSHVDHLSVGSMTRGSGLNASAAADAFGGRSWSTAGLDLDDYFEFSVSPAVGYELDLTSIRLDERRSGSGIREWAIRSSLDNFTEDVAPGPFVIPDDTLTRIGQERTLSVDSFSDLESQVSFRIYGYQAESSVGTWRIDNLELFGALTVVPEPNSLAVGLFLGGIAFFRLIQRAWFKRFGVG